MKKTLLLFCAILLFTTVQAQELVRQQEIGLSFTGLSHFGLAYRFGHQQAMWRVGSNFISGSTDIWFYSNDPAVRQEREGLGAGLSFGREFRKAIANDFEFRYGADVSFRVNRDRNSVLGHESPNHNYSNLRTTFSPGINLVLGLNYIFRERFIFGAELLPGGSYNFGTSKNILPDRNSEPTRFTGYSFGISSNSAVFTAMYRF
jgi:opacity protein-like surface antigen